MRAQGLGFGVESLGFGVEGLGLRFGACTVGTQIETAMANQIEKENGALNGSWIFSGLLVGYARA